MSKKSFKPSRAMQSARRKHFRPRHERVRRTVSVHKQAIELLQAQIRKGLGIPCLFHGGAQWSGMKTLLEGKGDALISLGKSLYLSNRRWIPDLTVCCKETGALLLAIEVWDTHSVSPTKRACFLAAGISWIEVRAWNVLERVGSKTLSILDWGGIGEVASPFQGELFVRTDPRAATIKEHQRMAYGLRRNDWPMPPASQITVGASLAKPWYGHRSASLPRQDFAASGR